MVLGLDVPRGWSCDFFYICEEIGEGGVLPVVFVVRIVWLIVWLGRGCLALVYCLPFPLASAPPCPT